MRTNSNKLTLFYFSDRQYIDEFFFNAGIPNIKRFLSKDYKYIQKVSEKQGRNFLSSKW